MSRKNIHSGLSRKIEQYICSIPTGELLPPEQEMAAHFEVSKPTLRLALAPMIERGFIETVNGVGSRVRKHPQTLQKELIFVCSDLVFFADTLKNFSIKVTNAGYISSIVPLSGDPATRTRILNTVFERRPAGVVLYTGGSSYEPPTSSIPILHLIRRNGTIPGDVLTFRNSQAMSRIVRLFYEEGCRKFALFGWQVNPNAAREREQGFRDGLNQVRLQVRENLICTKPELCDDFFAGFEHSSRRPDAVCCMNDLCAGDLLKEMRRRGIPYDSLKISGFDCSPVTQFYPRSILTVRMPLAELGNRAAELLIRRIENPGLSELHEKLESELAMTETMNLNTKSSKRRQGS